MSAHMISAGVFLASMIALNAARVKEVSLVRPQLHPAGGVSEAEVTVVQEKKQGYDFQELVERAKLAEQADRYEDMANAMKQLVEKSGGQLTSEQRNLLSVAYKNVVGARRSAWRIASSLEDKKQNEKGANHPESVLIAQYRETIEEELKSKCNELLNLIDKHLLHGSSSAVNPEETLVFFLKMKADYYRYLVEVTTGDERAKLATKSGNTYKAATKEAERLPSTHPIKLGLALNYSVFYYEIMNNGAKACEIAKAAFDNAIAELDSLKEDSYKDSTLIMQLLRDNLTLWTSENDDEGDYN